MNAVFIEHINFSSRIKEFLQEELNKRDIDTIRGIKEVFSEIVNQRLKIIQIRYVAFIIRDNMNYDTRNITVERIFSDFSIYITSVSIDEGALKLNLEVNHYKSTKYDSIQDFFKFLFQLDFNLKNLTEYIYLKYLSDKFVIDKLPFCSGDTLIDGEEFSYAYDLVKNKLLVVNNFNICDNQEIRKLVIDKYLINKRVVYYKKLQN